MNSNEVVLAVIALLGVIFGPIGAYLLARRKLGPELLLADLEAVRGWSEQRKAYEDEIQIEKNRRREEVARLESEIAELREALRSCLESEDIGA